MALPLSLLATELGTGELLLSLLLLLQILL